MVTVALAIGIAGASAVVARGSGAGLSISASNPALDNVVGSFAALSTTRSAVDQLPTSLASGVAAANAAVPTGITDDMYEGIELTDQSRELLSHQGTRNLDVYAYPTSKGRVCFTTSGGGGGCVTGKDPLGVLESVPPVVSAGTPITVAGIIPDNVKSVLVDVGSGTESAVVENNAYFYEDDYAGDLPSSLTFTFANSRTQTIDLPTADQLRKANISGL
jgi:hypothetical protein